MSSVLRWVVDLLALLLLAALGVAAVIGGLGGWVRAFIVVPLVVIAPGYALLAAIFPGQPDREAGQFDTGTDGLKDPRLRKSGIDGVERVAFAVVASIVVVPLVAVVAHFTPWGVTVEPILVGTVLATIAFSVLAAIRRARLHPDDRYHPPMLAPIRGLAYQPNVATLGNRGSRSRAFNVALLVAILIFASSIGYAAVNPPAGDGFTELSIDTPPVSYDRQSLYPEQFDVGTTETLPVVLTNQEGHEVTYDVAVVLQRVDGEGTNATVTDETELDRRSVAVADGDTANVSLDVTPTMAGDDLRLVVLAATPADEPTPGSATESLTLPIVVEDDESAAVDGTNESAVTPIDGTSITAGTAVPASSHPGA